MHEQTADRWHRIYMRTLRNLRDLRRYSVPVTINNPQQVNIAAEGGQQINFAEGADYKSHARGLDLCSTLAHASISLARQYFITPSAAREEARTYTHSPVNS